MNIQLTKQEIWKILDALQSYKKDYALSGSILKTIDSAELKLKQAIN